jgi:predicted ArsR family transcriptional regulator
MVCEYMAIYGRKPYALLLHRRIRNKGDAIATMIGVPKSQLEQEMPRAALEYLLTGKSKDGKYPVYAPDTASTSPSSISDSEWEETLLSARSSLGEETVTSILEKLEQGLLEKLDALPGDDVPPEERDAIVTKVIKSIEGTMAADASDFAEAVVSIGGRRKRAPWK